MGEGMYSNGASDYSEGSASVFPYLSRRELKRAAQNVFTPLRMARGDMYIERNDVDPKSNGLKSIQDFVEDAIEGRGHQVFLYGDSGVGKTNLLKHVISECGIKFHTAIAVQGQTIEGVLEKALIDLGKNYTLISEDNIESQNRSSKISISAFVNWLPQVGLGRDKSNSTTTRKEFIKPDLRDLLIQAMIATETQLLVIENAQNLASQSDLEYVGGLMEYFAELAAQNDDDESIPRIAAAGISSNATGIIQASNSIERRVKQLHVPHMADNKIEEIAVNGFSKLGVRVDRNAISEIVFLSDGYPYYAHELCLACCGHPRSFVDKAVDRGIVNESAAGVAEERGGSLRPVIARARGEVQTQLKMRSKVIDIVAAESWPRWTSRMVVDVWEKYFPEVKPSMSHISTAMNDMATDRNRMELLGSEKEGKVYHYWFLNPHCRPLLRMEIGRSKD